MIVECWQCKGRVWHELDCTFSLEDHDDDPLKGPTMDPNAALDLLRDWAETALQYADQPQELDAAQAFADLDRWLSNRGFLPKAWDTPRI